MKEKEDCFLKVKSDYLRFLKKEEIFGKSKAAKIKALSSWLFIGLFSPLRALTERSEFKPSIKISP